MDNKQTPPMLRVESKSGTVYYPKFVQNTEDEWEFKDKSFQKIMMPHLTSEKPVNQEKE